MVGFPCIWAGVDQHLEMFIYLETYFIHEYLSRAWRPYQFPSHSSHLKLGDFNFVDGQVVRYP
jgi:hypothetical protein